MKRKGTLNKATLALVAALVTGIVFTGCSSGTTSSNAAATETTASASSATSSDSSKTKDSNTAPADMKTNIESAVKELVTAGTITSDQGTKIVEALSTMEKPQGGKQDGDSSKQSNNDTSGSNNKPSGDASVKGGKSSGGKMNPLSKLVEANTITQAQADAVMEKIHGSTPQGEKPSNK